MLPLAYIRAAQWQLVGYRQPLPLLISGAYPLFQKAECRDDGEVEATWARGTAGRRGDHSVQQWSCVCAFEWCSRGAWEVGGVSVQYLDQATFVFPW